MEAWVGGGVEIQNVELVFPSWFEAFCFFFVFVLFFKEQGLGLIVFVEYRTKENKGLQTELEERLL